MPVISDTRRLRVRRVVARRGELSEDQGADIWQDETGALVVSGLWVDALMMSKEDVRIQAEGIGISPLEWCRRRLSRCSAIDLEVIG